MSSYEEKLNSAKLFIALVDTTSEAKTTNIIKCLDEGANINEHFISDSNNTPLHIAVIKEELEVVELLLKRGANTDYKNHEGKTALDIAKELDSDQGQVIVELLETFKCRSRTNTNEMKRSIIERITEGKYQKRGGTAGIKGQLYETKLITLIRIRSFIKEYDQFYLGTSVDGIGALDDICLRYKRNNEDFIIFLQAKHRAEVTKGKVMANDLWKPTGDFSLLKYFKSYVKIREKITKQSDVIFNGRYEDLKCYLVIYTSAGNDLKDKVNFEKRSKDKSVRHLLQCGQNSEIFQYQYNEDEVDLLSKYVLIEKMKCLGRNLFGFIKKNKFDNMLEDSHIYDYHVVLAQSVLNVSDLNEHGHRSGTFREDFFNNNDELFLVLKETLFIEAVKGIRYDRDILKELVQELVTQPTVVAVSKLMQNILIFYNYKANTLTTSDTIEDITDELSEVKIRFHMYKEARDIAIKEKLRSICLKLPATFGNMDVAVSDGEKGIKRLEYLAGKLETAMLNFKDKNVIINHELIGQNKLMEAGVLKLKGGLGSAVGNLLISNDNDESMKFNVNYKILGKNANILLKLLKSKISDLDTYRLQLDVDCFPKLSLKASTRDRVLVKDFFKKLWFYTNQAKEDEIELQGKEILENYCISTKHASERTATSIRYDAIYFKIHDEVQKWWMSEGESYYLTIDRENFVNILKEFLDNSLLSIISSVYMKRMKTYDIEFDELSVQSLCTQFESDYIVVVTEVSRLIGIKLIQHFQQLNDYAFIELDSPLLFSKNDSNALKEEIKNKELRTLIVIYEDVSESKNELFRYIIKKTAAAQLILVTNKNSFQKLYKYIIEKHRLTKVSDKRIEFRDLVPKSQNKILSNKFIFQGYEITFNSIIREEAQYLLTPCILQKIINNEKIVLGKAISNPNYEEIKHYYIDRQLSVVKESNEELFSQSATEQLKTFNKLFPPRINVRKHIVTLNTFEEINGTVILIGTAGTGKSSYLTHMSIKTKRRNPTIWIERINLLDYTKEFHTWHENKIQIDRIEALKFICKSAICKMVSRNNNCHNFDKILLDLGIINGEVVLRNDGKRNDSVTFELETFLYCYNKGNTVLLFDGFDEICPHYTNQITELLKCLVTRCSGDNSIDKSSHKQRMWIASRSYNNIITTLQTEFGAPYDLEALTEPELKICIKKFLKINLNMDELNYDQFMNIDGFFEYIKVHVDCYPKKRNAIFKYSNYLLHVLYFTAVEYFQSETEYMHLTSDKCLLAEKWRSVKRFEVIFSDLLRVNAYSLMLLYIKNKMLREEAMMFTITPLHMYVALDYFTNEIKNNAFPNINNVSKWNLETNTSSFYKHFLRTKLQKIRFEQKNQMDLYNPDVKLTCKKELKEYLDKHKKIAFYATFNEVLDEILTEVEINVMRTIISEFEAAEEKTGVVDYVINGVPKFIHLTIQEYLTAEYITDLLKAKPQVDQSKLWKFIINNVNHGVLDFFDDKFKYDNELKHITLSVKIKRVIFNEIIYSNALGRKVLRRRSQTIIRKALFMGLRHTTRFLLKAMIDVVNKHNVKDFIKFLNTSFIFSDFIESKWDDILILVLDCIRRIDPSKLFEIEYRIYETTKIDFASLTNVDIIRYVRNEMNRFYRLVRQRWYNDQLLVDGGSRRRTL